MSHAVPMCWVCSRLHKETLQYGWTCDAFPDKIPKEIRVRNWDHRKSYPNRLNEYYIRIGWGEIRGINSKRLSMIKGERHEYHRIRMC